MDEKTKAAVIALMKEHGTIAPPTIAPTDKTDQAWLVAKGKGAAAAVNYETWNHLMSYSKRDLAEIALHLAALCTESYDLAFESGTALARVKEEAAALRQADLI